MTHAIRFRNVFKSYDGEVVLRDFCMEVRERETKVVLGGSGSGKTTILKMVLGLVRPDSGQVEVWGKDVGGLSELELLPIRKQIGMVFQEGALFDSLSVGENVAYRMREDGGYSEAEIDKTVRQMLGFVGLEKTVHKMPSELSGGMRRRVAIARALVGNPRILLYDEPTAGLDPITSRTICDLIIKLRDLEGVASIVVTHDLNTAQNLASEYITVNDSGKISFHEEDGKFCLINTGFVILRDGEVIFDGSDEVMRNSSDPYIQEFLS